MTKMLICKDPQKGLNLVEMSIVVLIIGLLIGGALAGKEMLKNTRTRYVALKLDKYDAAVAGFYDRYQYLPGDLPLNLATNFLSANGTVGGGGNGNGAIECCGTNGDSGVNNITGEIIYFWNHLYLADLIQEQATISGSTLSISGFNPPFSNQVETQLGIFAYTYNGSIKPENRWHLALLPLNQTTTVYMSSSMSNKEVFMLDTKIDDGLPTSGIMLGYDSYSPGSLTSGNCTVTSGSNIYYNAANSTAYLCQPEVKMKF